MTDKNINFSSIYKDLDREEFRNRFIKQVLLWSITIGIIGLVMAAFLGYVHLPPVAGRCQFIKGLGDLCLP